MDTLISILGSVFLTCAQPLCGIANDSVDNFIKFRPNLRNLKKKFDHLKKKKQDISEEIEVAEMDGKRRTGEISSWIDEVDEMEKTVNQILEQNHPSCCFSFSVRSKLSNQVVEQLKEVEGLMTRCNPPYTVDGPVKAVELLPTSSIKHQATASRNLETILELLQDDRYGIIGMLGMGGVGKTTLIENLNNELESFNKKQEILGEQGTKPFSVVIWVVVSNKSVLEGVQIGRAQADLERVQKQIADRLKMPKVEDETVKQKATRLFNRLRVEKKFLVILDDVWNKIRLEDIGIPNPKAKDHVGCKVILTTRNEEVCKAMETDVTFTVASLDKEESWDLFTEKATKQTVESVDKRIAEAVCEECGGLPLALITVGTAMRNDTCIDSWQIALDALKLSRPHHYIDGIEDRLFLSLKWSYDQLKGKNIQPCFLYCCLYPEDFPIEINELIQCWHAEGLLVEENCAEIYKMGNGLIKKLIESCLLVPGYHKGTVRMHDVVRDVAVWISSSEDGCKSFVRARCDLLQIPRALPSESYMRVSFMYNEIDKLPDSLLHCSQVSSLLLQGNLQMKKIPFEFLRRFGALKVLNLSETSIASMPPADRLGELRALFMKNCLLLRQFPPLLGLIKLQILDLSGTQMKLSPEDAALKLNELNFQKRLLEFYVDLDSLPSVTFRDSAWLGNLERFRIRVGSTQDDAYFTLHNEKAIYLCDINCSSEAVLVFWSNACALLLVRCQCIDNMWAGYEKVNLNRLKSLTIDDCSWSGSMVTDDTPHNLLLPSLEVLSLRRVKNLTGLSKVVVEFGTKVKIIEITGCHELTQLFPLGSLNLESLEKLYVKSCPNLLEILVDSAETTNVLPKPADNGIE